VLASGHWVCLNAGGDSCSHGTTQVVRGGSGKSDSSLSGFLL